MATKEPVTLETLVAQREKEGVKVAETIVDFMTVIGYLRPDGDMQHEEDAVKFFFNRLLNIVTVEHGATEMLRVNLTTKVCPLFKNGSWQQVYDRILLRMEGADKTSIARKNEVRYREVMGLPKV